MPPARSSRPSARARCCSPARGVLDGRRATTNPRRSRRAARRSRRRGRRGARRRRRRRRHGGRARCCAIDLGARGPASGSAAPRGHAAALRPAPSVPAGLMRSSRTGSTSSAVGRSSTPASGGAMTSSGVRHRRVRPGSAAPLAACDVATSSGAARRLEAAGSAAERSPAPSLVRARSRLDLPRLRTRSAARPCGRAAECAWPPDARSALADAGEDARPAARRA